MNRIAVVVHDEKPLATEAAASSDPLQLADPSDHTQSKDPDSIPVSSKPPGTVRARKSLFFTSTVTEG